MAKRFGGNRGLTRKTPEMSNTSGRQRKSRCTCRTEEKIACSPSPNSSANTGESSAEHSSGVASEELVYKEPSMYDNLLMTLGSVDAPLADVYKRRQREEEGKSDTDRDEDGSSESLSGPEEESDGEESSLSESERSHAIGSEPKETRNVGIMGQSEDDAYENNEASDTDQEYDLRVDEQSAVNASEVACSFNSHLAYTLSKEELDNLLKKKLKYKVLPSINILNCKWEGTQEYSLEDLSKYPDYGLKLKLYKHWLDLFKTSGGNDFHSSKQILFFSLCNSYQDILHSNKKPFYLKGLEEDSSTMDAYVMHALNHIFRTRSVVKKNDAKLAKLQDIAKEEILSGGGFLDHGFTRPKVLILLPLASIALRVVRRFIQLTPSSHKVNVEHLDRFSNDFGAGSKEDSEDKSVVHDDQKSKSESSKPSDFQVLFGGNNNDHFMIGIKFTRGSIKLYSDFYSSDMIVASPLGLITKIGEAEVEKEKDVDYLSSIEVLIIDHADIIAMQNWSHVNTVVEQLNRLPSKQHGTDVMRIRPWYLDGHAQFYRQTIILASYLNPDINALFNHHCVNYQGKVKSVCEHKGILPKVLLQVRQIYERFNAASVVDADDARLEFFAKKVFPKIKDSIQGGIMLFISSYFEFVRLRNFLKSQNASFCLLGEYTMQSDISRARVWFFEGRRKIMLYTERAHFYHRYKIRGIQNLIIYSLPERKEFYPEIVNMLEGSHNMTCTVLFSRFDQFRLERIVGAASARRMVTSKKDIFAFC